MLYLRHNWGISSFG